MDSIERAAGRRPAAEAQQTRTAILTAALRLFADRGFDAVSLRDIATEANVTHGLIRHHFGAKDRVWQAVVDRADAVYLDAVRPAVLRAAESADPAAALETIVQALTATTARHPEITRLLLGEGVRGGPRLRQILERMAPLRAALATVLSGLQARGLLSSLDRDAFFLTVLLLATGPFGLAGLSKEITGRDPLTPSSAKRYADRLLHVILAQPPPEPAA